LCILLDPLLQREHNFDLFDSKRVSGDEFDDAGCRQKAKPVAFQHQLGVFVGKFKAEVGQISRHKWRPENRAHVARGQNRLQMFLDCLLKLFEKESENSNSFKYRQLCNLEMTL